MKTNELKNSDLPESMSIPANKITVSVPGRGETIEIDFDALNKIEPTKAGDTYPDLESQVRYSIMAIEGIKNKIVLDAREVLPVLYESDVICTLLDAINSRMASELETVSNDPSDPAEWFQGVQYKVYTFVEAIKNMIHLKEDLQCFEDQIKYIEYAKRGVLM